MLGLYEVFRAGDIFFSLISTAIVVYCVLSWFRPSFGAFDALRRFIQPFLSPFRKLSLALMRRFNAPLDFTCFFAIIGIGLIRRLWWYVYYLLRRVMLRG